MINIEQIAALVSHYVKQNPAKAILMLLTFNPVKQQLVNTLTDDQLEWLSYDIQSRPLGLAEYFQSNAGRQEISRLFESYRKNVTTSNRQPAAVSLQVLPEQVQSRRL